MMKENIKDYFNEHKKGIIIIGILFIIMLFLNFVVNNDVSAESRVKNYIVKQGFKLDSDKILYEKRLSDKTYSEYTNDVNNKIDSSYDVLLFDIYSFTLVENLYNYTDNVSSFLSASYNYSTNKLVYSYRVNYLTANIIFNGSYNDDDFICESEYTFDANIDNDRNGYCEAIKYYVEEFRKKTLETITSTKILNDMKK